MKPEPCHLALKLFDADEPCGACGHPARTHRNHASYVDPEIVAGILRVAEANDVAAREPVVLPPVSNPFRGVSMACEVAPEASTRAGELALRVAESKRLRSSDEFADWTPAMLRTAIAFERVTSAELRLELHREREQRQALERGIVEIRHAACAALTWATDSKPDVVNARRAVDELARRLRDELSATKNDAAREATLIRERDAARKELAELRAERERGYRAKPSIEVVGVVADRGTESAVLALAWARDPARTREEIESQIEKLDALAIDSPGAGYAASVLRWTIASPNRRTPADFDAARRAIDAGRELP